MPNFRLYYRDVLVGVIKNPFYSDDTWFGTFELGTEGRYAELERRVTDYIHFVEDWNERVRRDDPADPGEFEQYSDLVQSGLWSTKDEGGVVSAIAEAPVFFRGGDISWRMT